MTRSFSILRLARFELPVRRVLAIDAGSRRLKLLLAERRFNHIRVLREELLDLQAEGMVSPAESRVHLQEMFDATGRAPVALVLPQHLSTSQVLDLPVGPDKDVDKLIEDETVKLSGLSESKIVYDFVRLRTAESTSQKFWVTLCQEEDIRERIIGLGFEAGHLCSVTTTANALLAAYRATPAPGSRAILAHMGAQSTVIVLLLDGHGAFATSFPMGGEFFTRAIARSASAPEHQAEVLKRERNLLASPDANSEFIAAAEGWTTEFKGQLNDWFARHPNYLAQVATFPIVASGAGFEMPGFFDYLATNAGLKLSPWPRDLRSISPTPGFEVAYGAALEALNQSEQPVCLLPADYQASWSKRLVRQKIELASFALALLCLLLLLFGTWRQTSLIEHKQFLLRKALAGRDAIEANELYAAELMDQYESLRPMFLAQQNTLDTLKTLSLLQQSRSNRSLWYVLLADQQSYFMQPALTATNRPGRTNLLADIIDRPLSAATLLPVSSGPGWPTNTTVGKPGLIAELCVPEDPESARSVLSQLVNKLKEQPYFSKVDLLSDDLRRSLSDPKLVIPERHFVLALDFAATDFQMPVQAPDMLVRSKGKRGPRSQRPAADYSRPEPMLP